jgi:hypothetical protein
MDKNFLAIKRRQAMDKAQKAFHQSTPAIHTLWIVEGSEAQDAITGLPVITASAPALMSPPPLVMIGGEDVMTDGGATMRIGDARAMNVRADVYPISRLLAAQGFRLDSPTGDLYQIITDSLKEVGHNAIYMVLTRMSQPRA